jgi:hypothetical protein
MDASEQEFVAGKSDFVHCVREDSCGRRKFMKPKNALKTAASVAMWFFGEHSPTYLDLTKVRPEWTGLPQHEPLWHKMLTPDDAGFLHELNIAVDPADVLQPGEKTLGRQILEQFWAEDR